MTYTHLKILYICIYHDISNKFLYDIAVLINPKIWSSQDFDLQKWTPGPRHSSQAPVIPQFRGIPRVDPAITGLPGSYRMKGGPFCSWKMAKFPEWCMHFPLQLITHWFNDDPHWPPEGFGKNHPTAPCWSWALKGPSQLLYRHSLWTSRSAFQTLIFSMQPAAMTCPNVHE